tara:strand:- start:375 stop:563 length:189 start_codon:yes stop_codon:yes gene_type:complete
MSKGKKKESSLIANRVCTTFITDMNWIFKKHHTFNQDISSWDVLNVKKCGYDSSTLIEAVCN